MSLRFGAFLAVVAALLGLFGWQTWRLSAVRVELAGEKQARANEVADLQAAARAATARARAEEHRLQALVKEQEDVGIREAAQHRRVADALRVERNRLRDEIRAFTAGHRSGVRTEDALAACRAEAAAAGDLLVDALQAEEDLARAAEDHASSARTLLEAWERALTIFAPKELAPE